MWTVHDVRDVVDVADRDPGGRSEDLASHGLIAFASTPVSSRSACCVEGHREIRPGGEGSSHCVLERSSPAASRALAGPPERGELWAFGAFGERFEQAWVGRRSFRLGQEVRAFMGWRVSQLADVGDK